MNETKEVTGELIVHSHQLDTMKLVLWDEHKREVLSVAQQLKTIGNDQEFEVAGEAIATIGKLTKALEKERKALTQPFDTAKKTIMDREKELRKELDEARDSLRVATGAYATEQARKREEAIQAERERQAMEAMEQQRLVAEAAEAFGVSEPEVSQVAITPAEISVAVPEKLHSMSVKQVEVYNFEITDETKLARKFLSADQGKIRAFVNYLKAQGIDPATVEEPGLVIRREIRIDGK